MWTKKQLQAFFYQFGFYPPPYQLRVTWRRRGRRWARTQRLIRIWA